MSKSLEERFDREFLKILKEMYPSIPMDKAHSQDLIDFIQKEINSSLAQQAKDHEILVNTILDTKKEELAQYKREIREKIGMMSIYDIDDTPRSVINMHGYNDAIKDVLAELDKLNHTDKKEGGK